MSTSSLRLSNWGDKGHGGHSIILTHDVSNLHETDLKYCCSCQQNSIHYIGKGQCVPKIDMLHGTPSIPSEMEDWIGK